MKTKIDDPVGFPETFCYAPKGHYLMVYIGATDRFQRTDWGENAHEIMVQQLDLAYDLGEDESGVDSDKWTAITIAVIAFPDDPRLDND